MTLKNDLVMKSLWNWVLWVESGGVMPEPTIRIDDELNLFAVHIVEDPLCKDAVVKIKDD